MRRPKKIDLRTSLANDGWRTERTYSNSELGEIGAFPAVYLILAYRQPMDYEDTFVAYVGMSRCLEKRLSAHPVLREIRRNVHYAVPWFKPVDECDLRAVELEYIKKYNPIWNTQGIVRGVDALTGGTL